MKIRIVKTMGKKGATMVELALSLSVFILLVFGLIDLTSVFRQVIGFNSAVERAANRISALPSAKASDTPHKYCNQPGDATNPYLNSLARVILRDEIARFGLFSSETDPLTLGTTVDRQMTLLEISVLKRKASSSEPAPDPEYNAILNKFGYNWAILRIHAKWNLKSFTLSFLPFFKTTEITTDRLLENAWLCEEDPFEKYNGRSFRGLGL